ncbi:hypothetical protein AVT98_gp64 [Sulfolobales virus YNP1]|uniref:hypothetical protein n=1 Tax=Sulfolobales virus YNP1 TaxID=1732179 RepID=UPI0007069C26|nr:hypothetical protein AVT98_gp64 [Sulfolobales virus YNP1]ALG97156.1 hypothetical protein [Sulfolobales virus YNP1]
MLEVRWNEINVKGIWCKECNVLLAESETYPRKRDFALGECKHFKWEVESIRCFDDPDIYRDYCIHDPEYVKKMKKNFIIRFVRPDSIEYYDVLVPQEGEV